MGNEQQKLCAGRWYELTAEQNQIFETEDTDIVVQIRAFFQRNEWMTDFRIVTFYTSDRGKYTVTPIMVHEAPCIAFLRVARWRLDNVQGSLYDRCIFVNGTETRGVIETIASYSDVSSVISGLQTEDYGMEADKNVIAVLASQLQKVLQNKWDHHNNTLPRRPPGSLVNPHMH